VLTVLACLLACVYSISIQLAAVVNKMQQVNDRLEAMGKTSDSIDQIAQIWEESYDRALENLKTENNN
jgi:hypothetical protein